MGHRANLVLVDNTGYQLFFCHWCSKSLANAAFWGLSHTLPYVLQQKAVSRDNGWLDDVWSEGGLLLDTTQQVLLLYGGEDLLYDIPLRRLYLELISENWPDWEIRWAHEGIFDMADYVGAPRNQVLAQREYDDRIEALTPPDRRDYVDTVGSVMLEDGSLRLYMLGSELEWYLNRGPALVEMAKAYPGQETLPLHEWVKEHPQGGFHLDVAKKQVAFWAASDQEIMMRTLPFWSGWEIIWLKDQYEYQVKLAGGRLTFPTKPVSQLLDDLENILMAEHRSGLQSLMELVKEREDAGHQVEVNPSALRDDPQHIEYVEKRHILDKAIAAWKQKKLLN